MRHLAVAAAALLLAGCTTANPSTTATPPSVGGEPTTGSLPATAFLTSPAPVGELTIPDPPGEIARSVFGGDRQEVISGGAVEGRTLEARVACVDPDRGTAWFEVMDARVGVTGELGRVMSGRLPCDGTETLIATTALFAGPLQITFTQVPETAVEGYAILSTD